MDKHWQHLLDTWDDISSRPQNLSEAARAEILAWFERAKPNSSQRPQTMQDDNKPKVTLPNPMPNWFEGVMSVVSAHQGDENGRHFRQVYQAVYLEALQQNIEPLTHLINTAAKDGRHHLNSFLEYLDIKQFMPKVNTLPELAAWVLPRRGTLRRVLEQRYEHIQRIDLVHSKQVQINALETKAGIAGVMAQFDKLRTERDDLLRKVQNMQDGGKAAEQIVNDVLSERDAARAERDAARQQRDQINREFMLAREHNDKLRKEITECEKKLGVDFEAPEGAIIIDEAVDVQPMERLAKLIDGLMDRITKLEDKKKRKGKRKAKDQAGG